MIQPQRCRGFTLVEVALALGVVAFCLVAIFGLLPVGINSNRNSIEQAAANNIARAIVSDLRATPVASGTAAIVTSPVYGFEIPAAGQTGAVPSPQTVFFAESANATGLMGAPPAVTPKPAPDTLSTSVSQYRVSLGFTAPPTGTRNATVVRLLVTWPALADPAPAIWPTNYTGSYETIISLDRN
jgi:prepilin-type N-terminal cleavage/methylation domain-containing protein